MISMAQSIKPRDSIEDGGKAIVGNVTQHASVIVSDKNPAPAGRALNGKV
jgi:hypothetical protein